MSNHLHLIVSAEKGNLSSVIRDFKKFTSQAILEQIEKNTEESRRGCPPPSVPARAGVPVRTGCYGYLKA